VCELRAPDLTAAHNALPPQQRVVGHELDALVDRMLAKDPAARPPDGAALLSELDALSTGIGARGALSSRRPSPGALTGAERRVVSVVLIARGGEQEETLDEGLAAANEPLLVFSKLQSVAEGAGGHLERLADGSMAVVLGGVGVATDRAALAARFALSLRAIVPNRPIALAMGRGEVTGKLSLGEAIERATKRLYQYASPPSAGPLPIAIDEVTAALLEPRFEWREGEAGPELLRELDQAETVRTLLGRPHPASEGSGSSDCSRTRSPRAWRSRRRPPCS
jgi:hypothetical protein